MTQDCDCPACHDGETLHKPPERPEKRIDPDPTWKKFTQLPRPKDSPGQWAREIFRADSCK